MTKVFVSFFLLLFLYSCNTAKKTAAMMDSWIGSSKQKLIMKWGPPAKTVSDGSDGEVLIYVQTRYNAYNRYTVYDYKMMYAHADGKIYHWRTNSSATPPQQIDIYIR